MSNSSDLAVNDAEHSSLTSQAASGNDAANHVVGAADFAPCPFCESSNLYPTSNGVIEHFIECGECGASGPVQGNEAEAWECWNAGRIDGLEVTPKSVSGNSDVADVVEEREADAFVAAQWRQADEWIAAEWPWATDGELAMARSLWTELARRAESNDTARLAWIAQAWGGQRDDFARHVLVRGGDGDLSDIRTFVDAAAPAASLTPKAAPSNDAESLKPTEN